MMRLTELILERGMSERYMLNNVGDKTPPWGTPAFMFVCLNCYMAFIQAAISSINFDILSCKQPLIHQMSNAL